VAAAENLFTRFGNASSTFAEMNSPLVAFFIAAFLRAAVIAMRSHSTPTNDSTALATAIPKKPTPQYKSKRCFVPAAAKAERTVSTSPGSRKKLFWKNESRGTSQSSGGMRNTTLMPPLGGGLFRT
jgi:hypothetical protein